jgi:hypothetical protein
VETACAHCGQSIHISLTNKLQFTVREKTSNPLIFAPDIDWENFHKPHITGDL